MLRQLHRHGQPQPWNDRGRRGKAGEGGDGERESKRKGGRGTKKETERERERERVEERMTKQQYPALYYINNLLNIQYHLDFLSSFGYEILLNIILQSWQ